MSQKGTGEKTLQSGSGTAWDKSHNESTRSHKEWKHVMAAKILMQGKDKSRRNAHSQIKILKKLKNEQEKQPSCHTSTGAWRGMRNADASQKFMVTRLEPGEGT